MMIRMTRACLVAMLLLMALAYLCDARAAKPNADMCTYVGQPCKSNGHGKGRQLRCQIKNQKAYSEPQLIESDIAGFNLVGEHVILSGDGTLMATTAVSDTIPYTRKVLVFRYARKQWARMYSIDGNDAGESRSVMFARRLSMARRTKNIIAVMSPGGVHVFRVDRDTDTYEHVQVLHGSDLFGLGLEVSDDGSRIVVGAPRNGTVHVFDWRGDAYIPVNVVTHENVLVNGTDARFGAVIACDRHCNTVAIGAPFANAHEDTSGAVFVFDNIGADDTSETLLSTSAYAGVFSSAISVDPTGAYVAASTIEQSGHVDVFYKCATTCTSYAHVHALSDERTQFGRSLFVGYNASVVLVGDATGSGRVLQYYEDDGVLTLKAVIQPEETEEVIRDANFAHDLSVSMDTASIVVGAYMRHFLRGSVYHMSRRTPFVCAAARH